MDKLSNSSVFTHLTVHINCNSYFSIALNTIIAHKLVTYLGGVTRSKVMSRTAIWYNICMKIKRKNEDFTNHSDMYHQWPLTTSEIRFSLKMSVVRCNELRSYTCSYVQALWWQGEWDRGKWVSPKKGKNTGCLHYLLDHENALINKVLSFLQKWA